MKIAATGLSGLVGSRIQELLSEKYEFVAIGLSAGVDFTIREQVMSAVKDVNPDLILNLAGKADVDGSEAEKERGIESEAWKLNVRGAENLAIAAKEIGKRLIHISSDFVFDGERDFYTEGDATGAINWYGTTKLEGEKAVADSTNDYIIARIAYPYRANFQKLDFVRAMHGRLKEGYEIKGVTDHIISPTFIDDIASAFDALFTSGERGTYHVVGSEFVTPYDAAIKICEKFGFDRSLVSPTTKDEYFFEKAKRPFSLCLKNDKITNLGVKMRTFDEGLDALINQGFN